MPDEFLGEPGNVQPSIKAGLGAVFMAFWPVAELGDLLEP